MLLQDYFMQNPDFSSLSVTYLALLDSCTKNTQKVVFAACTITLDILLLVVWFSTISV